MTTTPEPPPVISYATAAPKNPFAVWGLLCGLLLPVPLIGVVGSPGTELEFAL